MAEAIGLGVSVVAFVGLASQVAQGCQYFLALVDDIKEASEDLRILCSEVKLFQLTIDNFKQEIAAFETSGFPTDTTSHPQAVQLALEYAEEAVEKLLKFARKISGTKWASLRFAFGKEKYSKLIGRVQRANAYISTAQASILLSSEHQQALGTRATHQAISSLTSTIDISSKNVDTLVTRLDGISLDAANTQTRITELKNNFSSTSSAVVDNLTTKLDGISLDTASTQRAVSELKNDFTQRLHDLSTGVNSILSSKFTASTSIVSERSTISATHHSVQEMNAAIEALHTTSEGLKRLPFGMSDVVKESFRGVILEFYLETQTSPTHAELLSQNPELLSHGGWNTERRVIHQTVSVRKYIRHIGIITVQSTTTTFWERASKETARSSPRISTVTHTNLDLTPNPGLLRLGVYYSFVQRGFARFNSTPEPKLRVYNVVNSDAPIVNACTSGNITRVRWLFDNGESSPFDRLWGDRSLLDLVLTRIIQVISSSPEPTQQKRIAALVTLYIDLVRQGLDPGLPRLNKDPFGSSPILALAVLGSKFPLFSSQILQLSREIIRYSVHDPLEGANILPLTWGAEIAKFQIPTYKLLRSQDEWPISWPLSESLRDFKRREILTGIQYILIEEVKNPVMSHFLSRGISFLENLLEFFFFDQDDLEVEKLFLDCTRLEEKLLIVLALISFIGFKPQFHDRLLNRFHDPLLNRKRLSVAWVQLVRRFQQSMEHCLHFGLNIEDPPDLFKEIVLEARSFKCLSILGSILLSLSQNPDSVRDCLEEDSYVSLAFQLRLLHVGLWNRVRLPTKLHYVPSHDLPKAGLLRQWRVGRYSWNKEPFKFRDHFIGYYGDGSNSVTNE